MKNVTCRVRVGRTERGAGALSMVKEGIGIGGGGGRKGPKLRASSSMLILTVWRGSPSRLVG